MLIALTYFQVGWPVDWRWICAMLSGTDAGEHVQFHL
jgi:hypothetical protein